MGARYPDQVGGHKPYVPVVVVVVMDLGPRLGSFMFGHDGGCCVFGTHGATQDLAQRGVGRSGREDVMAVGWFCRNALVHPNGSARPVFRGVGIMC